MNDIYGEATRGYEVSEAVAYRIRELIRDALDLRIIISGLGVFVEALPQPPYGVSKVLGRFSNMLEAQNFARVWLTGPRGIVKDVQFAEVSPDLYEIDLGVLAKDIQVYLEEHDKSGL